MTLATLIATTKSIVTNLLASIKRELDDIRCGTSVRKDKGG